MASRRGRIYRGPAARLAAVSLVFRTFAVDLTRACLLLNRRGVRRVLLRHLRSGRQLRMDPASAERRDQLHHRGHTLDLQVGQGLLIAQQGVLRGQHVDVWIDASLVAVVLQVEELLRGSDRFLLFIGLLREDALRGEKIFYLLK